jgi:hypothetical protein
VAGFKPPLGAVNNAKQAIEWRDKYPKEMKYIIKSKNNNSLI